MQLPKEMGLPEGEFHHLDSTPQGGDRPASVMTVEVEVENKPQELRLIRPYYESSKSIPQDIPHEAQITMHALFECFSRQGEIQEGLVGDLVWGFAQAGIPPQISVIGLGELGKRGFIRFQAKDNSYTDFSSDAIEGAWLRYQPRLLNMVYERSSP